MKLRMMMVWIALLVFPVLRAGAGDDVYDEVSPKRVKVKPASTTPSDISPAEQPVTGAAPSFGDNNYQPGYYEDDDYSDGGFSSYSDRITRFHQPSVSISATVGGYYGGYNNFYDPWAWNPGWYNTGWSQTYWFTPSPYWDYYNYWNPFSTTIVVINHPWQMNWGWGYDPWSPFGWNNYWYNSWYNPWYNPWNNWWTPACYNYVYNNWGWDYGYNYRNTIYAPRTGTSTNSPGYSGPNTGNNGTNYQQISPNSKNTGTTINKKDKPIDPIRYENDNNGTYYKPKPSISPNQPPASAPNQNWGTKDTDSGIKVIKKQK